MSTVNDMPDAIARRILPGQQRRARWRAERIMMVVVQLQAFPRQAIQIRGFKDRVAVAADIAIALIVSDDEHDIGRSRHRARRIPAAALRAPSG